MARSVQRAAKKAVREDLRLRQKSVKTVDSFQNFFAALGIGTDNLTSFSQYGFNPISRLRTQLEWMHRGSWLAGMAVDIVAEDMTRGGVHLQGELRPEDIEALDEEATRLGLWDSICQGIKWARLYGGCILVPLIDGQNVETPLLLDRVGPAAPFRGLLPLDRWMVEPALNQLVQEFGPDLGRPKSYLVTAQAPALSGRRIHHTRAFRQIGIKVPWWQELTENLWGISVIERLYDRMVAFDSATQGASQLVYKAHLRTYKIENLRELIAAGGPAFDGLVKMVDMMRRMQTNEGITLLDSKDEFEAHTHGAFTGLSDIILQFGQQFSGGTGIPLVRLFGQSPAGLNSTGESDLRMYYDGIRQKQVNTLKVPVTLCYRLMAQTLGITLPEGFGIEFNPLWQLTDKERSDIASINTETILKAVEAGLVSPQTGLKELKQQARTTQVWSNITDEDIAAAEEVPAPAAQGGEGEGGEPHPREGEGTPGGALDAKFTKAQVNFEHPAKGGDRCESCRYFLDRSHQCQLVAGPIEPEDWCQKFSRVLGGVRDSNSKIARLTWYHGLQVVVETPQGTVRRGRGWSVAMPADYGYLRRAPGADGDELDCYVGPAPESDRVFLIDQVDPQTKRFDEHKVMLGYLAKESAVEDYVLGYTDGSGPKRLGALTELSMQEFKEWLLWGNQGHAYQPVNGGAHHV